MFLSHHKSHTKDALKNIELEPEKKKEIVIGSFANDLCEFTNEGEMLIGSKDTANRIFGGRKSVFGSIAIYQSHFGNLTSMHSMAKEVNESPGITKEEITAWFDFLNAIAIDDLVIDPDSKIRDDNTSISEMFSSHSIEYDQIFDSENLDIIKSRAIGMMCHLLQDLFTQSHCERNDHNEIRQFYCYNVQDKQKHKEGDSAADGFVQELNHQCMKCIKSVSHDSLYDYSEVLTLSRDAQESGGGNYV